MNYGILPDISVIVPVYKVEAYIERCAKSLFEQSWQNLEFIFVNDCTPDKSVEILQLMMAQYPHRISQVKIINHETNRGVASSRNTGLIHATGKYIGWVDSDDWVDSMMFEHLYAVAKKHNSDIVWGDFYYDCPGHKIPQSQYCKENKIDFIQSLLVGTIHGGVCFGISRQELFIRYQIHFPDGLNVMEDKLVLIKLASYANNIKYVPKAYYYYARDYTNSITTQWGEDTSMQEAAMSNLLALLDFLDNSDLKLELQKYLKYAKLIYKRGLLNSLELKSFIQWKGLFSEENSYVWSCPNMTLRQKILGWSIQHNWWIIAKCWIQVKKVLMR